MISNAPVWCRAAAANAARSARTARITRTSWIARVSRATRTSCLPVSAEVAMTLNLTASYAVVLSIAVNTTTSVIVQAAVVPITTVLSYTSIVPYAAVTISASSVINTASAFRTSRHTGRTAVAAMEFTTIPTVVHTYMLSSWGTEVISATVVVAAIAVDMPRMSATIGDIEVRTSEVEVVAMRIAGIDAEVPVAGLPVEGAIEIGGCQEGVPLPVEKNIT